MTVPTQLSHHAAKLLAIPCALPRCGRQVRDLEGALAAAGTDAAAGRAEAKQARAALAALEWRVDKVGTDCGRKRRWQ